MNRILVLALLLYTYELYAQIDSKIKLSVAIAHGTNISTRPNLFRLNTPLKIPSTIEASSLRIQEPTRLSLDLAYKHLVFKAGTTTRALNYYSLDSTATSENCHDCQLNLKIRERNTQIGFQFMTDFENRFNFYFQTLLGVSWVKSSPSDGVNEYTNQTELIAINNNQEHRLVHVYNKRGDLSYAFNLSVGVEIKLSNHLFVDSKLMYDNQLVNKAKVIIYAYNPTTKMVVGRPTPYNLEFTTLYSSIGFGYKF